MAAALPALAHSAAAWSHNPDNGHIFISFGRNIDELFTLHLLLVGLPVYGATCWGKLTLRWDGGMLP